MRWREVAGRVVFMLACLAGGYLLGEAAGAVGAMVQLARHPVQVAGEVGR